MPSSPAYDEKEIGRGNAAIQLNGLKVQSTIRSAFPNTARRITKDQFVKLVASAAHIELPGLVGLEPLEQAAARLFERRLDSDGSGTCTVREALSHFSFGFTAAAGVPKGLAAASKAGGPHKPLQMRDVPMPLRFVATAYDVSGVPSPRLASPYNRDVVSSLGIRQQTPKGWGLCAPPGTVPPASALSLPRPSSVPHVPPLAHPSPARSTVSAARDSHQQQSAMAASGSLPALSRSSSRLAPRASGGPSRADSAPYFESTPAGDLLVGGTASEATVDAAAQEPAAVARQLQARLRKFSGHVKLVLESLDSRGTGRAGKRAVADAIATLGECAYLPTYLLTYLPTLGECAYLHAYLLTYLHTLGECAYLHASHMHRTCIVHDASHMHRMRRITRAALLLVAPHQTSV